MTHADLVSRWPRRRALEVRGIIEGFKLCGCGTNAAYTVIKEVLERAESLHDKQERYSPPEEISEWFEFAQKVLDSWGLLEHGGSICGSWLTDKGDLILDFLRDFGVEAASFIDMQPGIHPFWSIEFSWDENEVEGDSYWEWVNVAPHIERPN